MPKRKRKPKKSVVTKFKIGDKVRVKHGIMDATYPDIPIGGWAGTITEVQRDGLCTVLWSTETLVSIHPVFKNRCERDGLEFDQYWIDQEDLEPDTGGSLDIEHPKEIKTKPLSPKDQDDRIRMVLGLTSNDPLPDVDDEKLEAYHEHLSENLAFPFFAEHGTEYGHPERVKVIGLGDPDGEPMIDETHGILCEARMEGHVVTLPLGELEEPNRNRQLLRDYNYWLHNWS